MHNYFFKNLVSGYKDVVTDILESKNLIKNHMGTIQELYNVSFELSGHEPILFCNHRSYNPAFMFAESLWNLTGDTNPWLCDYNPKYKQYFVNGPLLAGYGNRLFNYNGSINQISHLIEYLKNSDADTALPFVCSIASPEDVGALFNPCIQQYNFSKRNGKIFMSTYMRAQDMSWGFPYDINICLSFLNFVACKSGLPIGGYTHTCDVVRLYLDNNISNLKNLRKDTCQYMSHEYLFTSEDVLLVPVVRDMVSQMNPSTPLKKILDQVTPYWKEAIITCYAYKNIRIGNTNEAVTCVKKYSSDLMQNQFMTWFNTRQK